MSATVNCMVMCPECYSTNLATKEKEPNGGEIDYTFKCEKCGKQFDRTVSTLW